MISYVGVHEMPLSRLEKMMLEQTMPSEEVEFILIEKPGSSSFLDYFSSRNQPNNIKVLKSNLSRAKAYNEGIKLSCGEIIYFLADDFILPKEAVKSHFDFHQTYEESYYVGVSSAIVPTNLQNEFQLWLESTGRLFGVPFTKDMDSVPSNFFYLGNTSVKHTFIEQTGLFNESFVGVSWEDYELGLRLEANGMKSIFIPEAEHYHNLSEEERFSEQEVAGENARYFKSIYSKKFDWESLLAVPFWRYKVRKLLNSLLFKVTQKKKYKHIYWDAELNCRFKKGFLRQKV